MGSGLDQKLLFIKPNITFDMTVLRYIIKLNSLTKQTYINVCESSELWSMDQWTTVEKVLLNVIRYKTIALWTLFSDFEL